MKIVTATLKDMPDVEKLFREYQQWIGIDLCFQGFEQELAGLPGSYAPPQGILLLAIEEETAVGCAGIRPRNKGEAELKRLYVQPGYQGRAIGKQLFKAAMSNAQQMGYQSVVLDTLQSMRAARAIYVAYGFEHIPAYYDNPEEGVEYYKYTFTD